jgi:hypothetical protein
MMIDADLARARATTEAQQLAADGSWRPAFDGATIGVLTAVRNLSCHGGNYFLVDFKKGSRSTGRMVINQKTGVVDLVTGIDADSESLPGFMSMTDAEKLISTDFKLFDGRPFRRGTGRPQLQVIWDDCLEAPTMFEAFYWVLWADRGVFLRIDGTFFDILTPPDGEPVRVAVPPGYKPPLSGPGDHPSDAPLDKPKQGKRKAGTPGTAKPKPSKGKPSKRKPGKPKRRGR